MRIMVTGGAGFIGSHVAEAYWQAGHDVLVIDDLSRGRKENLDASIPLEVLDVRDNQALEKIFSQFRPEMVNHHAAQVSVRDSVADPLFDADVNVLGGLRLLEACVKNGVRRFMFASTGGAIYGEQEVFPAGEDHPERPLSPYGTAKLSLEKYLHFYQTTHGISWVALRYSNVYGPRQDPFGEAGVVAIFCQRMISGEPAVINGDGEQTRDFIYVEDVAKVNLLALDKNATGAINVATGVETSVNHLFRELRDILDSDTEEIHGPAMPGEQRRSVLDPVRAQRLLSWKPEVELKEGLGRTAAFFKTPV